MKVLFLISSLGCGGAERVTACLSNHWAGKGWDVTIMTLAGCDRDFYALEPSVRRSALGLSRDSRHMLSGALNNMRRLVRLRREIRERRPDVAIGMMTGANCLLALACAGLGLTVLGSERIHPPLFPLSPVWQRVRRLTYPHLDGIVAQTAQSACWLRENAGARSVTVIANPLEYPLQSHEPRVDPKDILGGGPGRKVLLAVGRLEAQKGFDRLLEAFARLAPRVPDWRLVILGEGGLRAELHRQAATLGIAERACFPGRVGNIADWYMAADLYVLTSRYEGFPNTLLEAMAHGLPVVAVDCETGPRDVIRPGVDGLLVPQGDQTGLTAALERLMSDESLRRRLGREARSVRERFATARIARLWEDFMKSVGVK